MLPSFFIAHGTPSLAIERHVYTEFLGKLAKLLPKPKSIVIFSAHWESGVQQISTAIRYETIYDFRGFPDELYRIQYPARGDVLVSLEIQRLFHQEGIDCELNDLRGLDHGVWAPLHVMYPGADVPVVALSVNPRLTPEEHYRIGQAIAPLRQDGVLILGSGGTVHNLRKLGRPYGPIQPWALQFDSWLAEQLETWNLDALFSYEARAPHADDAVPTAAHFAPLLLAMGAAGDGHRASLLHHSFQMSTLSLCCWMFGTDSD